MAESPVFRRGLLALPASLLAAGCVGMLEASPAGRFAAALAELDTATGALLARIGQMQAREDMELAAIGYATGRAGVPRGPMPVAAAAHAMEPVVDALALHGRRLAALDGPLPPGPPPPEAAMLTREAEEGLAALRAATRRPVPVALRRQGMEAIRALAASPPPGTRFDALVSERQPAVANAAAYLLAVLGQAPGEGLRGALEARHRAALAAEEALLRSARADRSLSTIERYALFHRVAGAQSPAPAELRALDLLTAAFRQLPEAHASLASGAGEDPPDLRAFIATVQEVRAAAAGR
ncbi:MAG TPA: hypothetical protein VD970_06345 [Acetobacteraceae bacterium]|nr:hypothetical protein [Acetobacteraceae bacterium]